MGRVDEFPTVPYDPSQLTPGIVASLQNQSELFADNPTNLQEYMDALYDDYYRNVTAYSDPQELQNIGHDLENTKNTAMRQISNAIGGYDKDKQFQLFPRGQAPKGYENASHTMLDMLRQLDIQEKGESDITQEMITNAKMFGAGDPSLSNALQGTYDEKFANRMESFQGKPRKDLMSSRNFFNNLLRRYGTRGATEILRNHPSLKINRQRSLAEVIPAYQTENPFNPDGSIKPGAVPPVTAVKQMSSEDIKRLLLGAGLMPIGSQTDSRNIDYELRNVIPHFLDQFDINRNEYEKAIGKLRKPMIMAEHSSKLPGGTQAGSFVSPPTIEDIARAIVASKRDMGNRGMLGIRGLNPIDDFVQQRASTGQQEATSEGYVHSKIDPSRLVPIEIPKGSIPASVRGDTKIDMYNPTPSQDERVAALLGSFNDGLRPGVTSNTLYPKQSKRSWHKDLNLKTLFDLSNDGMETSLDNINQFIKRNEDREKDLDESLEHYQTRLKDLNDMTSQITNINTLVNHEDEIERTEFRIDDLEGEKERIKIQLQHLNHRKNNLASDFDEAKNQYADALRSVDRQLPFFSEMPQQGIDLDKEAAKLDFIGDVNELDNRKKLNFNLDKHGFPLNEDGTAMTLDEKINLVTEPDLKELAENIFSNKKKVLGQIRRYNTKLPFGDDAPTKRKIKPYELESHIKHLDEAVDRRLPGRIHDKEFKQYLDKLRREYADAR
jgi:hypothetical protein